MGFSVGAGGQANPLGLAVGGFIGGTFKRKREDEQWQQFVNMFGAGQQGQQQGQGLIPQNPQQQPNGQQGLTAQNPLAGGNQFGQQPGAPQSPGGQLGGMAGLLPGLAGMGGPPNPMALMMMMQLMGGGRQQQARNPFAL